MFLWCSHRKNTLWLQFCCFGFNRSMSNKHYLQRQEYTQHIKQINTYNKNESNIFLWLLLLEIDKFVAVRTFVVWIFIFFSIKYRWKTNQICLLFSIDVSEQIELKFKAHRVACDAKSSQQNEPHEHTTTHAKYQIPLVHTHKRTAFDIHSHAHNGTDSRTIS